MLHVGGDDRSRGTIAAHGTTSQTALRALWRLSDRDGDGFATHFGGVDCDDGDRTVNPFGKEIAGNGKDDNCSGGDLAADRVQLRTRPQPSGTPGAPKRNVVLISLDAVRADHLGAYGYARPTSPTLDALAARGARFAWAISPSPTTRRAIPALMTGRYASTIAFKPDGWPPVMQPKKHTVLGQAFKGAGYQTQAILCCATLFDKASGNVEGIDDIDATAAKLGRVPHSGEHLVTKAREWLAARKDDPRPFFLWMHFLDAHNPYRQPPTAPVFGKQELDVYDAEIAHVDAQIAAVIAALEETGELADTIIVVTADHGDEFYDHGNRHHGRSLYNELVRVPLIVAVPGAPPRVIDEPVSLVDIPATVLDLVGIARPGGQNGRSLAPAVLGTGPAPDRAVLAELIADRNITRNLRAAFHGGWKLIWDLDANTYELYSLTGDPFDRNDRLADEREVLADLRARLDEASDLELSLLPGESPPKKAKPPPKKK
jgi:arylsulfatase A-like enzyme